MKAFILTILSLVTLTQFALASETVQINLNGGPVRVSISSIGGVAVARAFSVEMNSAGQKVKSTILGDVSSVKENEAEFLPSVFADGKHSLGLAINQAPWSENGYNYPGEPTTRARVIIEQDGRQLAVKDYDGTYAYKATNSSHLSYDMISITFTK